MDSFLKPLLVEFAKKIEKTVSAGNSFESDDDYLLVWKGIMKTVKLEFEKSENDIKKTPKKTPAAKRTSTAKEVKEEKGCSSKLKSGEHKGKACGKPVVEGTEFCSRHKASGGKEGKEKEEVPKTVKKPSKDQMVYRRKNNLIVANDPSPNGSYFVINNTKDLAVCGKLGDDETQVVPLSKEDISYLRSNDIKIVDGPFESKNDLEDILDEMTEDEDNGGEISENEDE